MLARWKWSRPQLSPRWTPTNVSRRLQRCLRTKDVARTRRRLGRPRTGRTPPKFPAPARRLTLTFDDRVAPRFGDFVRERLQTLYDEYKAGRSVGMNRTCPVGMSRLDSRPPQRTRRTIGKRKRPPSRHRSGSPSLCWHSKNHTSANRCQAFLAPFRRADFLCLLRQRHAVTLSNDALWAAIADACPCGKPDGRDGAPA